MTEQQIQQIVEEVLRSLPKQTESPAQLKTWQSSPAPARSGGSGRWLCDTVEEAVANAKASQKQLAEMTLEKRGELIEITFPPARTQAKCRVFEYEVTATLVEDDVDLVQAQRRVMALDFHLPETAEGKSGTCVFAVSELPLKGRYRFDVRPVECFGHKGAPIHAELAV